ncbi:MAG: SDR family NAD(P)-dependent oxidoreductase, partial [Synergistaceae bacterium]|nr:SDR family NAD(P)-dependent oxidoreductase [Synergistaceae bacterium]
MLALVTGGAKGIGRAITLELARNGFDVAVNFNRSENDAVTLRDEVIGLGVKAEIFRADVSIQEEAAKMFADVKAAFGESVSVLVNNAGITRDTLLMRMKP